MRLSYLVASAGALALAPSSARVVPPAVVAMGRVVVATVPVPTGVLLRSATYTPSGKVLVSYAEHTDDPPAFIRLATMDDDGSHFRPFFAMDVARRPKDNGIRFMVFADNRRILTGDYVIECRTALESCDRPELLPVAYPAEIENNPAVSNRWSEIVVAPDNRHFSWDTLIARSAMVFTGELRRHGVRYVVEQPRIVSTLDPFRRDPAHPDGTIATPFHGGEVKQFVQGGAALSVAGLQHRDLPGSALLQLADGTQTMITNPPGYTETTIFSPDERLGVTMTSRFSATSNLAVLNLMPRPHPDSLNMGLSMFGYVYSVTGVRRGREGEIGPALIDVNTARRQPNYRGMNLAREPGWTFNSPMSWHPGGRKAMWIEGHNDGAKLRIRIVTLPDYHPARPVAVRATPVDGVADMGAIQAFVARAYAVDLKVYGRNAGYLNYRRSAKGDVEKRYVGYSDEGRQTYSGEETLHADPAGMSVYHADVRLTGAHRGVMNVTMTFGPLGGPTPARLIFDRDAAGIARTSGYAEYDGRRATVDALRP